MIVAQLVKNLPAMWEIWVQSLGWEDPLEKGVATYFQYSGLENSMDHIVHGSQRVGHDWVTFTSLTMITSIFRSLLPIFCFFFKYFSMLLFSSFLFFGAVLNFYSSLLIWKFYISTLLIFLLSLYIIGYLKNFNTHLSQGQVRRQKLHCTGSLTGNI